MRKILLLLVLAGCVGSASAQFPTTDSLRKYINRWVRNSAVDAFSNLRLNTALLGMTRFVDSTYGSQVVSFYKQSDSVIALVLTGGDTLRVNITAGGSVGLTNVGSGAPLLKSASEVKSIIGDGVIVVENNTNSLTFRADTTRLATRSWVLANQPDPTAYASKVYVDAGDAAVRAEKQNVGNYITELTGDVTAVGPGMASAVLSNTPVTPGTYTNATVTINSKGRITFADNGTGGSGGTNNVLLGSGYRWLAPSSQGIRTVYNSYGFNWDSTTNANGLTGKVDSSLWATRSYVQGLGSNIYTGTTNRITVAGNVIDISGVYPGQPSITTLGTVGTGSWEASPILPAYGGVPAGGTTGQVLTKNNNAPYNYSWITPPPTGLTSITAGNGLLGGTITSSGTIRVDTAYLRTLYSTTGGGSQTIDQTLTNGNTTAQRIEYTGAGTETFKYTPNNAGTAYSGFGRAATFHGGWNRFDGVNVSGRPNVVATILGYNHTLGGGRIYSDEAGFGFRAETDFQLAGVPSFEFHLPEITTQSGTSMRLFSMYTRKTTGFTDYNFEGLGNWVSINTSRLPLFSYGQAGDYIMKGYGSGSYWQLMRDSVNYYKVSVESDGSVSHAALGENGFDQSLSVTKGNEPSLRLYNTTGGRGFTAVVNNTTGDLEFRRSSDNTATLRMNANGELQSGTMFLNSPFSGTGYTSNNIRYDAGWKYVNNGGGALTYFDGSDYYLFNVAPGTAGAAATLRNRLFISESGNFQTPSFTSGYLKFDGAGNWTVDAGTGGGGGSVTSVSGGSTGFSFTAGSTPTMSGTLGTGFGGTGKTSYTAYNMLYAASSSTIGEIAPSSAGTVLTSNGTSATPSFQPLPVSDATGAVFTGSSTSLFPASLTGVMPIGNGESGMLEISIYAINAAGTSSFCEKIIVPYLGNSPTTTVFGTESPILTTGNAGSSTISAATWNYNVNGSGDITISVIGVSGQTITWRAEIKKYSVSVSF